MFVNERVAPISVDGYCLKSESAGDDMATSRYAYGIHLIHSGADICTVQQYIGHANIQNMVLYTALSGEQFELFF